jgi:hypothetical protein
LTSREITKAFAACSACYGARFRVPVDDVELEGMVGTWALLLSDIPDELGMAAFAEHCRTNVHPPTPADIRQAATVHTALPSPGEAWAEVIDAARRIGYQDGEVPDMSRPEIRDAARAAGWSGICFADSEMSLSTTRAHFFRIYDGMCARTDREEKRALLEGRVPAGLLPNLKRVDGRPTIGEGHQITERASEGPGDE